MQRAKSPHSHLIRRLTPLYLAAFFQGFVLWYAVEKLFMINIGFDATGIGLMAAAYSFIMLVVETPSGILADRWSRTGVLILGSLALGISSIICGLSHSPGIFIFGASFWGVFAALYSGTYDSIIYDTLTEEVGNNDDFEKYYGRIRIFESLAYISSSLLGGLIGASFGLSASFLWTIPFIAISIICLTIFREPQLHKAKTAQPILGHIKATFKAVAHHSSLVGIILILVLGAMVVETILEFNQLWLVAVALPVVWYGLANSVLLSTFGIAGAISSRLRLNSRKFVVIFTTVIMASASLLSFSHVAWELVFANTIVAVSLLAIGIVYLRRLHDQLPSTVRAGASSAISTLGRALFIAASLLFGWLVQHFTVFRASWVVLVPLAIICVYLVISAKPVPAEPVSAPEANAAV